MSNHEGGDASRSTDPAAGTSSATDVSLREYEDLNKRWQVRFEEERDRRYTEVKNAEEKALRIKEQADRDALGLAREIQTYKDEKANELREQINSERNLYPTKAQLYGYMVGAAATGAAIAPTGFRPSSITSAGT